jgi:putative phosphoesterase
VSGQFFYYHGKKIHCEKGTAMNENLIGIIADTHDNRPAIQKAVEVFNRRGVGLVVHAGDMISPFTILDFKKLDCPMEIVFGNNDGERVGLAAAFKDRGTLLPGPRAFSYGGRRFLLMHENACIEQVAHTPAVDIIVYGHTHDVDVRQGPPLVINPGEAGGWLRGRSTMAILDLASLEVEIIDL